MYWCTLSNNASYQHVNIKAITKLLQNRYAHIIHAVSQLTYPTFLRKIFVSVYLHCSLTRVLQHHKTLL
jgi:hypothetical protein